MKSKSSKNEVYARVEYMRAVYGLGNGEGGSGDFLTVDCWGEGRKRYLITLALNSKESYFFAPTTAQACDTLRTINFTLSVVIGNGHL